MSGREKHGSPDLLQTCIKSRLFIVCALYFYQSLMCAVRLKLTVAVLADISDIDHDLIENITVLTYQLTTRHQLKIDLQRGGRLHDIDAIFTNWVCFDDVGGMDRELISCLSPSVKLIVIPRSGFDKFDIDELTRRNIILCNTPAISAESVADVALFHSLAVFRYTRAFDKAVRLTANINQSKALVANMNKNTGEIGRAAVPNFHFGSRISTMDFKVNSPSGKRAGIAGLGRIGKLVGARLNAIGMKVSYWNRSKLSTEMESQIGYSVTYRSSFEELCSTSDLLVLILPLSPNTIHILNKKTISLLPNGAKIVNVGRGSSINEEDLLEALSSGKISSAGLDVYEDERNINPKLLDRDDVFLTPHVGACSDEVNITALEHCMINIKQYFETGNAVTAINE